MKNNILHRFAINDLKKHKRDSMITMITIFFIALIIMIVTLCTPLFTNQSIINYEKQHGTAQYEGQFDTLKEHHQCMDKLKKDYPNLLTKSTTLFYNGITLNDETIYEVKGNREILSIHLKEGHFPQKKDQIAVKSNVLINWGYQQKMNQKIKLSYVFNHKVYVKEFKVVGILDATGPTSIVSYQLPYEYILQYMKTTPDYNLNDPEQYHLEAKLTAAEIIDMDSIFPSAVSHAQIKTMIQAFVILVSVAILYGFTVTSFEKRQSDYTLLRSIGATQRQMYYIIFIQILLLSIIPIILALGIVYIISLVLPLFITLPVALPYHFFEMLWDVFLMMSVVVICYFLPARGAMRQSLTGAFDQQEFQYFYYRYKKHHQLTPFYLAWRQVASVKKKMIIKIFLMFIITISLISLIRPFFIHYNPQAPYKENDIEVDLLDENVKSINQEDFAQIKKYAQNVILCHYVDESDMYRGYHTLLASSLTSSLYCFDQTLKDYYDLPELKSHQILLSAGYLNSKMKHYQVNDKVEFAGEEFEFMGVVDDEKEEFAILHQDDFKKFGNRDQYQKAIISFKNIQQKREIYLSCANDIYRLKNKYWCHHMSDEDTGVLIEQYFQSVESNRMVYLVVIASLSVIYIYQFIFELLKQKEDIGSYQLLGATKIEIGKIYFDKSMIIAFIGFALGVIWDFFDIYYTYQSLTIATIFLDKSILAIIYILVFIVMAIIVVLSLLPLRRILKRNALENKNTRE